MVVKPGVLSTTLARDEMSVDVDERANWELRSRDEEPLEEGNSELWAEMKAKMKKEWRVIPYLPLSPTPHTPLPLDYHTHHLTRHILGVHRLEICIA
jgi:hypothetical protein